MSHEAQEESVLTVAGLDPIYTGQFTVTSEVSQMRTDQSVQMHTGTLVLPTWQVGGPSSPMATPPNLAQLSSATRQADTPVPGRVKPHS